MRVSALAIAPVKGMRLVSAEQLELDEGQTVWLRPEAEPVSV